MTLRPAVALALLAMLASLTTLGACAARPAGAAGPAGGAASDARSRAVDAILAPYDRADAPGASVAVVRDGRVVYARSFGLARVEDRVAATPATDYRLASVTKQFTAMCILMLVREGRVRLDEHLTDIFPEWPAYGRRISVRQLLTHTSGLIDYEDLMAPGETRQIRDAGVIALLQKADSTYFEPGTQYRYSNSGYATLAMIVERRSGMPFGRFLATRIFQPLDMRGTLAYEQGVNEVPRRALGYTPRDGGFARTDQSSTSAVLGDGGIYSNVLDLAKWDQALYGERLVDSATLRLAFTPLREAGIEGHAVASDYGFGWEIDAYRGHRRYHHNGETVGFRNTIHRFPGERLAVIVLCNRADARPWELAERIADVYLP